jgi:tRNA pseudouridine55 synthase
MTRRREPDISGLLIVDKPRGITSHDVVDRVRKLLGIRRIGHTGILDPNATGVLPLCVGRATRLAQFIIAESKTYEGVIRLGFATTTYDAAGEPTTPAVKPDVPRERLEEEIAKFRGKIQQIPPMFSAKKVGGVKLYELAREGKEIERAPVDVEVFELEITSFDGERVGFRMRSSSGAYVRNVAHDLGRALGCGGHLETLNRAAVGHMTLDRAAPLDALTPESARAALIPMEKIPLEMPLVRVTRAGISNLRRGAALDRSVILDVTGEFIEGRPPYVRVADAEGHLAAIGERVAENFFQPRVVLFG